MNQFRCDLRIRCKLSDIILISASDEIVEVFNGSQTVIVSCRANGICPRGNAFFQLFEATARMVDVCIQLRSAVAVVWLIVIGISGGNLLILSPCDMESAKETMNTVKL